MSITRQKSLSSSKLSVSTKSPSRAASVRPRLSSVMSLLGTYRGSVAFRIGKSGFKVPRYQNTYQMESSNPFTHVIVDKILKDVMDTYLTNIKKYGPAVCLKICQDMATEIRKQIFKKDFTRYKYIVSMSIIEKLHQGVDIALGFLWDTQRDTYSQYVFENAQFYAIGIVAGVYYE
ncbi:tctex1 domain-containing protein 1-like [Chelonus insularis]|uniref:tctex1 domain-containing protein 1-like n=1 Tax=Chelonus insularis TaxID=460826 RepID=UPI00158E3413|nr:tctex1 domain-containing protein 1-like [Chelonus insularis]